ncbi:PREDICTED: alpha-tocopherol transfer protein-like isoform X2 [Cyphomyrmex costatus]|uniref:alpha-tocopherol transfer protein-like isoform X2 n=1 Tax=Cyphomyrmex costatus TaxID=456900 RepID=UPI000852418C|nr:PREDICTED: alpha-tocopherol transfer protein-like isoform X2 [Cyphomyrmex costatus]
MSVIKEITLEEEMKKNPQLKLSDIESLREWCDKQPHLPKIEDSFLVLFLHSNYYQMEPTKNTIENYYTIRTHLPEIFCNRDPLEEKGLQQSFKTVIHGYILVIDADKFSFGHMMRTNPLEVKKHVYYIQEALPIRLKAIHVINAAPAAELLMKMAKPFMKNELMHIIRFHLSLESLSEYIPVDALPNETGGKAGSVHKLAEIHKRKFEDYREWFLLDESTRRVNEALRIGKSKTVNDLFGIDGNFKKLDID